MNNKIDFDEIAQYALSNINTVLNNFLTGGKYKGCEYVVLNPTRNDNRANSFSVNTKTGRWADFATGDKGGDLISLVAYVSQCGQVEAAQKVGAVLGLPNVTDSANKSSPKFAEEKSNKWQPLVPIPEHAKNLIPQAHPTLGKPSAIWTYHNKDGQPIGHICRFETSTGKVIRPLIYCQSRDGGTLDWRWQNLPAPRPLYNLHKLVDNTNSPIVITEGEKAADAAQQLFPDCVVTTSAHGAMSPTKTDWSPLSSRNVIIWPDNDAAGKTYASTVKQLATDAGARVSIINIDKFLPNGTEQIEGFDAADALDQGWTAEDINKIRHDNNFIAEKREAKDRDSKTDESTALFFDDIEAPEIKADFLPSPYREYANALAASTQTPPGAAAIMMLSILATCLQKKFVVAPYGDNYVEPLVVWILVILAVGERKTALMQALLSPISDWESDKSIQLKDDIEKNKIARQISKGQIDSLTNEAIREKDGRKRQQLEAQLSEINQNMPQALQVPQLYTSDVTPESLEDLLIENEEAMSILSDEGDGVFEVITGLYSNGRSNLDIFLKGHASSPHKVRRQKRRAELKAPAVTQGLTIQPGVLERLGSGNKRKLRGIGHLARYLFYMPQGMVGRRNPRKRITIDQNTHNAYHNGIKSLLNINRPQVPLRILLEEEALENWVKFQEWLEPKMTVFAEFGDVRDWASKAAGTVMRISGLLQIAETGGILKPITAGTVLKTIDLVKLLITHAAKALGAISNDPTIADAKWALDWILQNAMPEDILSTKSSLSFGEQKTLQSSSVTGNYFFKENDLHMTSKFKNDKKERLNKSLSILSERNIISETIKIGTRNEH